jgi:1-acyl-sn-glycerol-3-phosphate acyltransferase
LIFLKQIVGYWVLKLIDWSFDNDYQWQNKQVVIGFPHTSNMDGVRALLMFPQLGISAHFLIKQELFRWPFSWVLRFMGGVPVFRGQQGHQVEQIVQQFASQKKYTLVLAPEGTRAKMSVAAPVIKTGFWHIAQKAGVPIVLMLSDEKKRRYRFLGSVLPGDDPQQDLQTIQAIYQREGVTIKLPDITDQLA